MSADLLVLFLYHVRRAAQQHNQSERNNVVSKTEREREREREGSSRMNWGCLRDKGVIMLYALFKLICCNNCKTGTWTRAAQK